MWSRGALVFTFWHSSQQLKLSYGNESLLALWNRGLKLKKVFCGVCVIMNDENKPGCLYICSTSAVTLRISNGFWFSFYFFMILGHLGACLKHKKAFHDVFIPLDTWHMLESGPRYFNRGFLVRRLRTTVLGATCFTFLQWWQLVVTTFSTWYFDIWFSQIEYYLLGNEDVSRDQLFRYFSLIISLMFCWVPRVPSFGG